MTVREQKELGTGVCYGVFTLFIAALFVISKVNIHVFSIGYLFLIFLLGFVWISLTAVVIALAVNRPKVYRLLLAVPTAGVLLAGLVSFGAVIGALVLLVFLMLARRSIHREMESRIAFRPYVIFQDGLRLITVGVFIALLCMSVPSTKQYVESGALYIPTQTVAFTLRPFTPLLENYISGYDETKTVNELIDFFAAQQAARMGVPITAISNEQKKQMLDEISHRSGVRLQGSETTPAIIASMINQRIDSIAKRSSLLVIILLIVVALLVVRAIVPFIIWPSMAFVGLCMLLARATGLVHIKDVNVKAERLFLDARDKPGMNYP